MTREQLDTKVRATIRVLKTMTPAEREAIPSSTFGLEYNKIREVFLQLYPDLKDAAPPAVEIATLVGPGGTVTKARYVELFAYYEQLNSLSFDRQRGSDSRGSSLSA